MKKIILFLLSLLFVGKINAQISVESFSIENSLDAKNYPKIDKDGVAGALIKIITTAKGFSYDLGQLPYIEANESKVGEIWLYVPEGTMKLKISHGDLGSLRGADVVDGYYMFNQRLKRATVYRMVLTHKEVFKMIGFQDPGNLTFQFNMEGCEVFLGENEKSQGVIEGKSFSITWPKGQSVKYRIHKDRYEDVIGTITVNESTNVPIILKPLFATVNITSIPGATIYIDSKKCGTSNVSVELEPGIYNLKVLMDGYRDVSKSITVRKEEVVYLSLEPELIRGSVSVITSPTDATIYIDGKNMGNTPQIITNLDVGNHQLELKKSQYVSIHKTINIIGDRTINVNENFTTKINIQRLKDRENQNQFGVHFCADVVSSNTMQVGIENYLPKVLGLTFEVGGFYGFLKTEECYWYDNESDLIGSATYTPIGAYLNVGIGVKTGVHFRITPYVGMKYTALISKWNNIGYSSEDPAKNSNAIGAVVGCKFLYLINEHFHVSVAPNYSFGVSKSKGYNLLSSKQPVVKNVLEGFNVKCGVSYYF